MVELIPFFALVFYLIPFCVAAVRNCDRAVGVLLLNVLTGWTIVGWWVALVWALAGGERQPGLAAVARPGKAARSPLRPVMPRILDNPSRRGGL